MSDMRDFARLSQALRREVVRTKDLIDLADLADTIMSSQSMLETLLQQSEAGKRQLAAIQTDIEKGKEVLNKTTTSIATMLRDADEKATKTVKDAETVGEAFKAQAKDDAKRYLDSQQTRLKETLEAKFKALTAEITAAEIALADLQAKTVTAATESRDAQAKAKTAQDLLEKIQVQARKIMGGG